MLTDFWALPADGHVEATVQPLVAAAEARRVYADYDTGSILPSEACALMSVAMRIEATVVIEVGTFIGLSTTALASAPTVEAVYTCDISNDCLPSTDVIHTYPKQRSTDMLRDLLARSVKADVCFFDGTLDKADAALLAALTHPRTVYAFHDYNHGPKIRTKGGQTYMETVPRKGIGNVRLLQPQLPSHVLVKPRPGTVLAFLVP